MLAHENGEEGGRMQLNESERGRSKLKEAERKLMEGTRCRIKLHVASGGSGESGHAEGKVCVVCVCVHAHVRAPALSWYCLRWRSPA